MEFPVLKKTVSLEKMIRYSGDKGMHGDDAAARKIGLPGAIVQGGQLAGYLNEMLVKALGRGYLEGGALSLSFIKSATAGDELTTHAELTGKSEVDGRTKIECDVWIENQHGEKVTVGSASGYLA
jgi:acyl dehydratase